LGDQLGNGLIALKPARPAQLAEQTPRNAAGICASADHSRYPRDQAHTSANTIAYDPEVEQVKK
jgi:hypothetical protein